MIAAINSCIPWFHSRSTVCLPEYVSDESSTMGGYQENDSNKVKKKKCRQKKDKARATIGLLEDSQLIYLHKCKNGKAII